MGISKSWVLGLLLLAGGCQQAASPPPKRPAQAQKSYLQQAEEHYRAKRFQDSAAFALLAVEDTKAKNDAAGRLKARALLACSEARLGSPRPAELRALLKEKKLDKAHRQRVRAEVDRLKTNARKRWQSAQAHFRGQRYQSAMQDAEEALKVYSELGDKSRDGAMKYLLSRCYAARGDKIKAGQLLEQAARARPPSPEAQAQLHIESEPEVNEAGNLQMGYSGGLNLAIAPGPLVAVHILDGDQNLGITLKDDAWIGFKQDFAELRSVLRSGQTGVRVVGRGRQHTMVMCVGQSESVTYNGYRAKLDSPLEVWLCPDGSSPLRAHPEPNVLATIIQRVDRELAKLPRLPG